MRGGEGPAKARHAVLPISLVRHSASPTEAGQMGDCGINVSLAQRELRARGSFGVKGRIAACPRLLQMLRIT